MLSSLSKVTSLSPDLNGIDTKDFLLNQKRKEKKNNKSRLDNYQHFNFRKHQFVFHFANEKECYFWY